MMNVLMLLHNVKCLSLVKSNFFLKKNTSMGKIENKNLTQFQSAWNWSWLYTIV